MRTLEIQQIRAERGGAARGLGLVGLVGTAAIAMACGSTDSVFPADADAGPPPPASESGGPFGDGLPDGGDPGAGGSDACASLVEVAAPAALVAHVVLDRSESMGVDQQDIDDYGPNAINMFRSARDALVGPLAQGCTGGFFADPMWQARRVSATLTLFGLPSETAQCRLPGYANFDVAKTALPSTTFGTKLMPLNPGANGSPQLGDLTDGTPTLMAFEGVAQKAKASQTLTEKHAIVLVTDGEPNRCGGTAATVSAKIAQYAADVPTFIVGLSKKPGGNASLEAALAQMAAAGRAGGTPIMVNTNQAQVAAQKLRDALATIVDQSYAKVACKFAVPEPPPGRTLDLATLNVELTLSGAPATLPHSPDCADPRGWRFDDPANPTTIELCSVICQDAQADPAAKVAVVTGCVPTRGVPIR